jgi:cyclomaltodextrinase
MGQDVHTPDWVKHAIFYQIFPDRFARSERIEKPHNLEPWDSAPSVYGFKGGDLLGVTEKLDYLQDLGVNAIYFNPIFQSASNHRYHTHDYYQVDPILGGSRAFQTLLKEAQRRSMRIVLDGVFNHASRGFFQFNHILECGADSPYVDWFEVRGYPLNAYQGKPNYRCWIDLPALPEFNTENPQVRQFIFDVARYWLEQGIDGWRLDVPFCIDDDAFWQEFRQVAKSANPEAYLVGEIPWEAQRWLQGDQFDAVMNYQFTAACLGFFAGGRIDRNIEKNMMGLPETPALDAAAFAQRAEALLQIYPHEITLAQLNLLDSHDMPRFISLAGGDQAAYRLAALFQKTYPGAPCIYYGDEIGLAGGKSNYLEDARRSFPWDAARWDRELLEYIKRLTSLRRGHAELRSGDFSTVYAEGAVYAYLRSQGAAQTLVAINSGEDALEKPLPVGIKLADGSRWKGLLGLESASVQGQQLNGLRLAPRSAAVLSLQG